MWYNDIMDKKMVILVALAIDGNTPGGCVIRPGDVDPITGEVITAEFFEEYRKILHEEAVINIETERVPYSRKEMALRRQQRADIAADLEAMGCEPARDAIACRLDEIWDNPYNLHIDALPVDSDGESPMEKMLCFADADAEKALRRAEFDELAFALHPDRHRRSENDLRHRVEALREPAGDPGAGRRLRDRADEFEVRDVAEPSDLAEPEAQTDRGIVAGTVHFFFGHHLVFPPNRSAPQPLQCSAQQGVVFSA